MGPRKLLTSTIFTAKIKGETNKGNIGDVERNATYEIFRLDV